MACASSWRRCASTRVSSPHPPSAAGLAQVQGFRVPFDCRPPRAAQSCFIKSEDFESENIAQASNVGESLERLVDPLLLHQAGRGAGGGRGGGRGVTCQLPSLPSPPIADLLVGRHHAHQTRRQHARVRPGHRTRTSAPLYSAPAPPAQVLGALPPLHDHGARQPHYVPETSIKLDLLSLALTFEGLAYVFICKVEHR